jgi:CBS domain-containing protein
MPHARSVRELIRKPAAVQVTPQASVRDAARAMAAEHCGSVLVIEGEQLLGIFTERDLLDRVVAGDKDIDATPVEAVMTRDPDTIAIEASVCDAIRMFDEFSYRHLPVTEDGRIVGVISTRDLPPPDLEEMQDEIERRHVLTEKMW